MRIGFLIMVLAFAAGFLAGRVSLDRAPDPPRAGLAATAGAGPAERHTAGANGIPGLAGVVHVTDAPPVLQGAQDAYQAALADPDPALVSAALADLLAVARAMAGRGELEAARTVAAELSAAGVLDPALYLLRSELEQKQGRLVAAMDPLLELIIAQPDHPLTAEARAELRLLVNVREASLLARRDQRALVRLFRGLAERDPAESEYRLRLARWLLEGGDVVGAGELIDALDRTGPPSAELDDLRAAVALARDGLPLEQESDALYVKGTIAGRPVRLLVDTGARSTVLGAQFMAGLEDRDQGLVGPEDVAVRTAGGAVRGSVRRVREVRFGGLHLAELDVLVLENIPPKTEGLLGMDVLGRLPPAILSMTLLGRPPASG